MGSKARGSKQPRIAAGRRRKCCDMEHAKAKDLGSKGIRELSGRRFGQGRRTRARALETTLDIRQEQRRQEVLRGKPQSV
eukprot:11163224-Heterocapsa_arctica.AAC.1